MPTSLACLLDSESGDVVYSDGPLSDRFPALHELVVYPLEYRQLHLMGINTTSKSTLADVERWRQLQVWVHGKGWEEL